MSKKFFLSLAVAAAFMLAAICAGAQDLQSQVENVASTYESSLVNITSRIVGRSYFNQPVPEEGVGSGFIYDDQMHIVTNNHVVDGANSVFVTLVDGSTYQAKIVGTDPASDLAVLSIQANKALKPIPIGDSNQLKVGQFVTALGNPFGLAGTLTFGVVSALDRTIQSPDGRFVSEAIQTDAAINPGNSGGPLLNLQGQVVGVNSQIVSASGASASIGFAIPSSLVQKIVPVLISKGTYDHPYLGIQVVTISSTLYQLVKQAGFTFPVQKGVLIVDVGQGTPAAQAGLKGGDRNIQIYNSQIPVGGDIIVAINGQAINSFQDLNLYLENKTKINDSINVEIYRGSNRMTVPVKVGVLPRQTSQPSQQGQPNQPNQPDQPNLPDQSNQPDIPDQNQY